MPALESFPSRRKVASLAALLVAAAAAPAHAHPFTVIQQKAAANNLGSAWVMTVSTNPGPGWEGMTASGTSLWVSPQDQTHAFLVYGLILAQYQALNTAYSVLAYPITDEQDTRGATGRYNDFQGGSIYWKRNASAAYQIGGWIGAKWHALGDTDSVLGYPTSNEKSFVYGPITNGRINWFERGYLIYDGHAGSWDGDTWPLLSVETVQPTRTGPAPWVTGRAAGNINGAYYLFGCGFSPTTTVFIYQNSWTARSYVTYANIDTDGCFLAEKYVGPFAQSSSYNGVVTIEVEDANGNAHTGTVALPWAASQNSCLGDGSVPPYYMVGHWGRFIWCVSGESWQRRHAELLGGTSFLYDLNFPEQVLSWLENKLGVPFVVNYGQPRLQVDEGDHSGGCSGGFAGQAMGTGVWVAGPCFDDSGAHTFMTQETTNLYTGMVSGGWPRDWWADHKSPFPTFVTWNVLYALAPDASYNLDYIAQHGPGPKSSGGTVNDPSNPDYDPYYVAGSTGQWDPQEQIYHVLQSLEGWPVFATMFKAMKHDGVDWNNLCEPPDYATVHSATAYYTVSKRISEYVAAYLSLGWGWDLTSWLSGRNVGGRPYQYANGLREDCWLEHFGWEDDVWGCQVLPQWDNDAGQWITPNTRPFNAYTLDPNDVKLIADAHCRIGSVAASNSTAQYALTRLRAGDFSTAYSVMAGVTPTCAASGTCPPECTCTSTRCSAPW
jgi:hypothetical protein